MATLITDAGIALIHGSARVFVRNSNGIEYAVVDQSNSPPNRGIQVWKKSSGTWSLQDSSYMPDNGDHGAPSAAIDSNDLLHIANWNVDTLMGGDGGCWYATFRADGINDDFTSHVKIVAFDVGVLGDVTPATAIALDTSNVPHVAFVSQHANMGTDYYTVDYINKVGGTWNSVVEVEGQAGQKHCYAPSLSIDASNYPVLSYANGSDNDLGAARGDANKPTLFNLHDPSTDLEISVAEGVRTSIAVDSGGDIWIAFRNETNGYINIVRHAVASGWTTWDSAINNTNVGLNPSLAIDGTDVYVFYEDDLNDIVYDKYTGSWAGETQLEAGTFQDVKVRWAYVVDNDSTGTNRGGGSGRIEIDYAFSDGSAGGDDIWEDALVLISGNQYTIDGAVTVSVTIASTLDYTLNASIIGAVTILTTVASAMDYTLSASIAGAVTVPITVAAAMVFGHNINGDVTVPVTVAASLMEYAANHIITGDVDVSVTVASAMDYTLHASIDGVVTILSTIAAVMQYTPSGATYTIDGDVTVTIAVAAALDYTLNASISGSVTVPIIVASTMDYTLNASIVGVVSIPLTIASTMDYTLHASIDGAVTVPLTIAASTMEYAANHIIAGAVTVSFTIASAMDYTLNASISGAVSVPVTVASTMQYTPYGYSIVGDVTVSVAVAAAIDYTLNASLVGAISVPIVVASTMDYTLNASISGAVSVLLTPTAGMLYNLHASITGAVPVSTTIAATMLYSSEGQPEIIGAVLVSVIPQAVMSYEHHVAYPPGIFDRDLFDRALFDEPGSAVSEAITTTSGILGLLVQLSGESDASLVLTTGNLTKVGFPDVGTKELRQMPWSRLP